MASLLKTAILDSVEDVETLSTEKGVPESGMLVFPVVLRCY
jgi:hypothetical protein